MRLRRLLPVLLPLALLAAAAQAQDFDPHGRHHGGGGRPPAHGGGGGGHAAGGGHGGGGGAHGGAAGAGDKGPSADVLIARYTPVVLSQPGAAFPLQRLAQLYRDRDGNIAKLVADFEARAAKPGAEQYAATVALAGLQKIDGRVDDAIATYEKAIALKSDDATAILALARLHQDRGELAPARQRFEQALPLQTAAADKQLTLRTLRDLALDQKDWDAAKKFQTALVKLDPSNIFVKGELGKELYNRSEWTRAEAEFKEVVAAAAGDNRALAPALLDLGRAQAKAHENDEALKTLEKARAAAPAGGALLGEIYAVETDIYRADQQLPVLIKKVEDEHPADYARLALLGGLYEETGDSAKAIDTYRKALAIDPRQIDLRLRMIRLLQANGDLDKAIAEYDGLIRAAPNNPQFVFEECEALMQRGDRARALKLVTELEARAAGDEEVLARVADFYQRIGENDRALKVLQRLATGVSTDPGPIVDLGDRYFQDGNQTLAVATWKRILVVVTPRSKALAAIGDVYLEHDMTADAITSYKEALALEPQNLVFKKALAGAYERVHAYRDARTLYEEIIAKAREKDDKQLARECRTRIVALWGLERVLEQQVPVLKASFGATPPDVEAGRMLAEAELHLRRLGDAETTLKKIIELAPGDSDSYLALERVLVQQSKIADAIAVLEKLVQVEPKRARELYERMADYALQPAAHPRYTDDDAIKFAARAVELNPDDAEGHRRLGKMYSQKQDVDHAIAEYRAAIAKNDRDFRVYIDLARLLLSKSQSDEADRLYRRVMRGSPDEDLVAEAARLSMQINIEKSTLESLEQDLLPLAIGNPQRPIYRRLLVETYGNLTFALVQTVRHGSSKEADDARAALARIGSRAVKPLLDALADADVGQQRIAIDVLAYVQNPNAALPLFAYATGPADVGLRTRAMLACGAIADDALVPKLEALLFPREGEGGAGLADSVGLAAVWGLARMHDAKALPVLRRVARGGTPAMRGLAVLGMGMAHDKTSVGEVAAIARSIDAGNVARAAAAHALGELDAQTEVPTLLELAEEGDALPRRMALAALARMAASASQATTGAGKEPSWQREAVQAMADAAFAGGGEGQRERSAAQSVAETAAAGLATVAQAQGHTAGIAGGAPGGDRGKAGATAPRETLPMPEGTLEVEGVLEALLPHDVSAADRAAALLRFADPVQRAALAALRTSGDRARAVLDALGSGDGELDPFVAAGASGPATDKARAIEASLEASIVPLAKHPDAAIRTKAIVLVARSSSDAATEAVVAGLEDADESVQRVALAAVGTPRVDGGRVPASARAVAAVGKILATHDAWAMRVLAAQAMGRLGAAGAGPDAATRLGDAATKDAYALVREAALEALATYDATAARALAARMATSDAEPRVREEAKAIAGGGK